MAPRMRRDRWALRPAVRRFDFGWWTAWRSASHAAASSLVPSGVSAIAPNRNTQALSGKSLRRPPVAHATGVNAAAAAQGQYRRWTRKPAAADQSGDARRD